MFLSLIEALMTALLNNFLKLSRQLLVMYANSLFTILAGADNCNLGSTENRDDSSNNGRPERFEA